MRLSPPRNPEQGAALILTVLVLAVMVILVVQFTFSVRVEEQIVQNTEDDAALEVAARSALPLVEGLFRDDRKNGNPAGSMDTLADIWCDPNTEDQRVFQVGQVQLTLEVEDLDRRFPLLWLADEDREEYAKVALKRLIELVKPVEGIDAEATADLIADKVKQLAEQGSSGGEAARGRTSLEQLLEDQNLDRAVLFGTPGDEPTEGLAPYVTLWPLDTINLNTAFAPVLGAFLPEKNNDAPEPASLWEQTDELLVAIRRKRIDPTFVDPEGTQTSGEMGASRQWPGTAFEEPAKLTEDVHDLLKTVFSGAAQGQGQGQNPPGQNPPGQNPPGQTPPGQTPPGQQGEEQTPGQQFQATLAVESRYYAVRVTAELMGGEGVPDDEDAEPIRAVYRVILYRNPQDTVTALSFDEVPQ
ncbi:MAG: type II secretion system protein GspK [Planctomycetota bacterium]